MKTILVVDDSKAQLELIESYLQSEKLQIITANNGIDGLAKAMVIASNLDLIITDLVMPGISGLELCRQLKKEQKLTEIPIIVCSTKDRNIDKKWAFKQGAIAYLVKPFARQELITVVNNLLDLRFGNLNYRKHLV